MYFDEIITNNDHCISGISKNQPRICPSAVWNTTGITFVNDSIYGSQPGNIFIDVTNAIYVISRNSDVVRMWSAEGATPRRNLSASFNNASSVFVTGNGDIYASDGAYGQVVKWGLNTTISTLVMTAPSACRNIFVDINNTLYCSVESQHHVVKRFLDNNNVNTSVIAAGNGSSGSLSNMLSSPKGIFVSTSFNLYVADCGNDRIQLFTPGNAHASTLLGNGSSANITLSCPNDVALDADEYLFIADGDNHRIIGQDSNGFRCIIGCSATPGSASDHLNYPRGLAFDSFGNLFVVDKVNNRIQKFLLATRYCSKFSKEYLFEEV